MTVGVDNANFTVNVGEIFVVMGLSGSGKSTIVRMLNRLIEPTAGDVIVDGQNVSKMSQDELVKFRLHNMSMVFQSFALMPHLTVLDNAAFGLELAKVEKSKRYDRAMRRWNRSDSRDGRIPIRTSSAAACSSGWDWPGGWPWIRESCSWTRPFPPWTP